MDTQKKKGHATFGWKSVRGEILETFNSENEIEEDDQHSYSKTDDERTEQNVSFDNTFADSSDSKWNSDEESHASNENNGKSCIASINISCDNENCLEDPLFTADNLKKDDDGDFVAAADIDDDDNKQDEHVKKHQHSLAREYADKTSTKIESTGITTSHYEFIKTNTNEEHEPLIYDDLNEPQSGIIVLHLNSKLKIVPNLSFSQSMRFRFGGISHPRESKLRLTLSGCSQLDGIPFSESGIDKRDFNFKLGALATESDDDENPFKRRLSLRWLFQYGFVPQGSVLRLQHWLRHQLYPFTNIKDFWDSLGSDSPPSLEERMSVEWMRYQSFQNYPISAHGSTSRLARDGFYYTGQGTQTRCFSCGISHSDWNCADNPHEIHQRLSPNCPFLNGREERYRNIPMSPDGNVDVSSADSNSIPLPSLPLAPLSGLGTSQSRSEVRILESSEGSRAINEDNSIKQNLGSGETTPRAPSRPNEADDRPKYPEHDSLSSRFATFSHRWPPHLSQTPMEMAEAGFFFTGNQDYTRCYHCGGGLRNWEPGDNPWIEHCRWYPMCPHVQKGKGQRFVNAVLKKQAELLAIQRAECRRKAQYGNGSTDPLETLAAITVLEMGYPQDTVRNSILTLRRQKEPGADITAQEVLEFIWKEEDNERRRQEEEASRPRHPKPSFLPTLMERLNLYGSPAVTQTGVMQSASFITTISSLTTAAMALTSNTVATSSTVGAASITSMSTSASGTTQNSHASGQEQKQDESEGNKTNVGGAGDKRVGSVMKDGGSEANVKADIHAQNHEITKQEQQRPIRAVGSHPEVPGANASAMAEAIEDEEFHSLDSEEMKKKEIEELKEENERLKDLMRCKICLDKLIGVLFIPCGHFVCETCAPAFRKCPICRKRIHRSVKPRR